MSDPARDQYISSKLTVLSPDLVYDHYQTWGQKLGIYYTGADGILTAKFTPIGPEKKWETDMGQFVVLADRILASIAASLV